MRGISIALFGWLLMAPAVLSTEAEPVPGRPSFDSARDLEIEVRARRQLLDDEELAPFNLGVHVHQGVAVVSGPVSSPEMKAKALKKIENVRGVFQVQSEMYVSQMAGLWVHPGEAQLLPDAPEQSSSAMPDWRTGKLPSMPGQLASSKIGEPTGPPKIVTLMQPVAVPEESSDLATIIERLRNGDERYRLIQFEMKDGAIYLRGSAKPEHAMAFARALSKVPGVERVVLQSTSNSR
jgi:hypothetical protein